MRRLVARLARAITRTRPVVHEDVCWCGIHHLGGYIHDPTPVTHWHFDPALIEADPAPSLDDLLQADPTLRTVTVELAADITAFQRFARTGAVPAAQAMVNATTIAKQWDDVMASVQDVLARESSVPVDLDRLQIQLEGRRQKAIALGWWDTHLDDLYADLGIPRDHHLTRGEN
jgi:hypothetical protein